MCEQTTSLSIHVENMDAVTSLVNDVECLMAASPAWLAWLASKAFEGLHQPVELVSANLDVDPAPFANELRIHAQLADEFVLLVAALRAGNGESGAGVAFELEHDRFLKKVTANV